MFNVECGMFNEKNEEGRFTTPFLLTLKPYTMKNDANIREFFML